MHPVKVYGAKPAGPPADGNPLLAGLIAGALLAVAWTFLVYVTHNPVSLAAWGVGGLIGLAVAKSARAPGASLGTLAALLTVGTVVLTKVLILAFALRPMIEDEILRSGDATAAMFLVEMITHRSFSPDLQAALDRQDRTKRDTVTDARGLDLRYRMIEEARARAKAATPVERQELVRTRLGSLFAHLGFLPLLGRLFGLMDFVWLGLGIASAWKLAQSSTG